MEKKHHIVSYCRIQNDNVELDGRTIFENTEEKNAGGVLKALYKKLNLDYPKFHKMDRLCKLAIIAAELLKSQINEKTAIVFSNHSSSIASDQKHQQSIDQKEGFVSPAVFVYTLPNITVGEVSIKHGLQTENAFFINDEFSPKQHFDYESILLNTTDTDRILGGWVNYDQEKLDAFIYIVAEIGKFEYSKENLASLYNQ